MLINAKTEHFIHSIYCLLKYFWCCEACNKGLSGLNSCLVLFFVSIHTMVEEKERIGHVCFHGFTQSVFQCKYMKVHNSFPPKFSLLTGCIPLRRGVLCVCRETAFARASGHARQRSEVTDGQALRLRLGVTLNKQEVVWQVCSAMCLTIFLSKSYRK